MLKNKFKKVIEDNKNTIIICNTLFIVTIAIVICVESFPIFNKVSYFFEQKYIVVLCTIIMVFLSLNKENHNDEHAFLIFCFLLLLHSIVKYVDEEVITYRDFDLTVGQPLRVIKITFDYFDHVIAATVCLMLYRIVTKGKKHTKILKAVFVFMCFYYLTMYTRFPITKVYDEIGDCHGGNGMFIIYTIYTCVAILFYRELLYSYDIFKSRKIVATLLYSGSLGVVFSSQVIGIDMIDIDSLLALDSLIIYLLMNTNDSLLNEYKNKVEMNEINNRLLFSQIKPHFLYNTLTTIKVLYRESIEEGENTLIELSEYFKGIFTSIGTDNMVDFEKEIDHVKHYVNIEKRRFDNLEVIFDIMDKNFKIPSLSIQPLVENAIKHGLENRDNGLVIISSYLEGDEHIIVIEDNGRGIFEKKEPTDRVHVGMKNVKDRLVNLCNAKVDIDSKVGEGTIITIKVPVVKQVKENKSESVIY